MKFPGEKKFWIILVVIIILFGFEALSWKGYKIKETSFLESFLYQLLRPFQKIVANVHNSVNDYWILITNLKEIKEENERLTHRIQELEFKLAEYNKIRLENERLRKLLAFKELVPFKMVGAKVIGITPNNWIQDLIIDRGSKDGIKNKMPVITYNGALVGQISQVTANTARVTLLTDVNFVVGGRVQREDSRAIGIIRGQADKKNFAIMDQIAWDAEIKEGDLVITSGLTSNFPMGIPIGRVTRVKQENFGLIQQAEIELFMSLTPIEEVLVITDF
ncbi:rod shape-determining protein MreC [Anoxybacter fermentans]|uniref:Cell shape-determining protein MreC n=1 Tax=Anoxybacter fermentans TaxID=1323375 RepID=A0A3Q9HQS7_9FIRM|nr:rod shape-determining protein MreC [Anoxybacter fermentans]AZR73287.1 rod shape-determining protein MreC [Anoxybacter fermentans]